MLPSLGVDNYREGPGPVDPSNDGVYPVIADPPGTELNQAYLKYTVLDGFTVKAGRQIVTYRKAPLHRYLGTVLWRQNWQTHDGVTLRYAPGDNLDLNYGYSAKVNRIFGNDAPNPFDTFDCDCHFINARYGISTHFNLEAYGYLLDIDNAAVNSTNTGGIRASLRLPVSRTLSLLSTGEFAIQSDAAQNPGNIDADYYLGEIGLDFAFRNGPVRSLTLKFNYEVLEGNGAGSFVTPLATGHAFPGLGRSFFNHAVRRYRGHVHDRTGRRPGRQVHPFLPHVGFG